MRLAAVLCAPCALAACGDNLDPTTRWQTRVIDPVFRSEGVTVFDVDRDGHLDIVTSERWYRGPDLRPRDLRSPRSFDPATESSACFAAYHRDVDGDDDEDLIVVGAPGTDASWCANPGDGEGPWPCHLVAAPLAVETPLLADLFDTGFPVLIAGVEPERALAWFGPGVRPEDPWVEHVVTTGDFAPADRYAHGLGVGDVNGDGRTDLLTSDGWVEQPEDLAQTPWPWHPVRLCPDGGCGSLHTADLDRDGLTDIVGTSPHGYGVWWWQRPEFIRYQIDASISQTHASRLADLDGDGRPEIITGKRWFVRLDQDPGALDPALLVAYHPQGLGWSREILADDVGVGSQFEVADVTGDGRVDIIVSNKKGLAVVYRPD